MPSGHLNQTLQNFLNLFDNINDDYLKGKKDDLDLLVQAILRNLIGHSQEALSDIQEPVIIVTHSLSPSDTLSYAEKLYKRISNGDRWKNIPCWNICGGTRNSCSYRGIKNLTSQINSGDNVVVDGIDGEVITGIPTMKKTQYYLKETRELSKI